jgi:Uma2 family endonuclease
MSLPKQSVLRRIVYPESDGKPMAETEIQLQLTINLLEALKAFFARRFDVYVGGNMFLYYVEGDRGKNVAPDVFVVRGVGKQREGRKRRTYKLWEEGVAPCVVIEITSSETKNEGLKRKKDIYAMIGVREYFIFDPEYRYLRPPFRAYRLSGNQYVEVVELGLDLIDTGETPRLLDPARGEILPTHEEESEARQRAETARQVEAEARRRAETAREVEAEARRRAEAEVEKLRAELARHKRRSTKKPPKPSSK